MTRFVLPLVLALAPGLAAAATADPGMEHYADRHCAQAQRARIADDFRATIEAPIVTLRDRAVFPGSQVKGAELLDKAEGVEAAARSGDTTAFHSRFRAFIDDDYTSIRANDRFLTWAAGFLPYKVGTVATFVRDEANRAYPNYELVPGLCRFLARRETPAWEGNTCQSNARITAFMVEDSRTLAGVSVCAAVSRVRLYQTILLVQGDDLKGAPLYSFVRVSSDRVGAFMAAEAKPGFRPDQFGQILASGAGDPSPAVYAEMKRRYGFDRATMTDMAPAR